MEFPAIQGKASVSGDCAMPGILQTGAMLRTWIFSPGGQMIQQPLTQDRLSTMALL